MLRVEISSRSSPRKADVWVGRVVPSGEPGVSGDFWGSQEGCQGPSRYPGLTTENAVRFYYALVLSLSLFMRHDGSDLVFLISLCER